MTKIEKAKIELKISELAGGIIKSSISENPISLEKDEENINLEKGIKLMATIVEKTCKETIKEIEKLRY